MPATGAELPPLTVTSAVWRRTAAGFASAVSYAEKVLGVRFADNGSSNGGGLGSGGGSERGGRGRGGRGQRGGGADARGRGGRDKGRDITRQLFEHQPTQHELLRQQKEQQQQEWFNQQVAAMSSSRGAPAPAAADAGNYFYSPDDDYSSNSSHGARSDAYSNYVNFHGYDNHYAPGGAPRGRGKIGVGNRGRSYRSNNR